MYMDENDVRSPRDRVDGELLRRLLGENSRTDHDNGCGCQSDTRGGSRQNTREGGCGCDTDTRGETRRESRRETRENTCGCDANTRNDSRRETRENRCGCDTDARNESRRETRENRCGCDTDTRNDSRRDTRENRCGCDTDTRNDSRRDTREGNCGCNTNTRSGDYRNAQESNYGCGSMHTVEREMRRTWTDSNMRSRMSARNDNCGCADTRDARSGDCDKDDHHHCEENGIEGRSLAMVYAPVQCFHELYDMQTGLNRGTVFRELDLPFRGDGISARGGNCRGY